MKKSFIAILITIILVFSIAATASMLIPSNENAKDNAKAPEKSPAIGENWELEKVDFIHYAKPDKPPKGPKEASCYKLFGVKWKTFPVTYVINPSNIQNMSVDFVTNTIQQSAETWDDVTYTELFNDAYTIDYSAEYDVQNYENAIVFDEYSDNNVIGVTSVWFTRKGRKIVEFDILFNTKYIWGDATNPEPLIMDLQNIATHELGHGVGLDDIYSSKCSEVTMYGYSSYKEIKKRTLETPDIEGLQRMYGI